MKPQTNKPNSFLWKLYFVTCGVLSLICWNSVLNLGSYTSSILSEGFRVYITFSFCLGSLLSFVASPIIFGNLSHRKGALLSISLTFVAFFSLFLSINVITNIQLAQIASAIAVFLCGFFGSFFQSKSAGLAASASNAEMVLFNFGTGLAGFSSNIFAFIIEKMYPQSNDKYNNAEQLQKQLYANLVIVAIFAIAFFIIEDNYEKTHAEYFDTQSEQEIEAPLESDKYEGDKVVSMSSTKIIRRCLDLYVGLLFQYAIILAIITFFLFETYNRFDKPENLFYKIPTYLFFFNISDTIGKFVDSSKLIYSPNKLHTINFLKLTFLVYFIYIVYVNDIVEFLASGWFRCIIYAVLGFINGYFTNCFFSASTNRFVRPLEKGKAAYFCVFFLLMGITIGSFLGVLYAPPIAND